MLYRVVGLICSFVWAGTILATKLLAVEIPSFAFAFIRYGLVVLTLLPFFIKNKEYQKITVHDALGILFLGFLQVVVVNALFFTSLSFASATSVAFIDAINPIGMMLIATMLGQFTPNRLQLLAFPLGFIGVTLLITHGNMGYAVFTGGIGELFALAAVLSQVLFALVLKKLNTHHSTLYITFMTALSGLLFVFPFIANREFVSVLTHLSAFHWKLFAFISVLGSSLATFLYASALRHLGPSCINRLVYTTMPIFTLMLAYLLLGETISIWQVAGGTLVIGSLVVGLQKGG